MTILSDTTIRELCEPSLRARTYEELRKIVLNDEEALIRVCRESDMAEQNKVSGQDRDLSNGDPLELESLHKYGLCRSQVTLVVNELTESMFELQEYGMIYPFNPSQTREVEMAVCHSPAMAEHAGYRVLNRDPKLGTQYHTKKIISSGTTSYGYDVSLSRSGLKLFTNQNSTEIDPKRFNAADCLTDAIVNCDMATGEEFVRIPPNSYLLGVTPEYFRIPRDILAICLGKSTYARAGILINVTPIEPGFEGNVVIEIANTTPLPARVYLNEGIAQFLFFRGDKPCEVSYADRGGKYQGQTGVQMPLV